MFEQQINELEKMELSDDYTILKGSVPILFSAPHTINYVMMEVLN